MKDRDCPVAGCLGFAFTLPSGTNGFSPMNQGQAARPQPQEFPIKTAATGKPDWMAKFMRTSEKPDSEKGGQCYYPTLPTYPPAGKGECIVPNWEPAKK